MLFALTNVTAQVEAERAREAALAEARRASAAKSTFLANIGHELRTPLNGVLGIAELLESDDTNPAQAQMFRMLRESGTLLLNIINDLLDMTKIEADALELENIPFALADLARRTEELHTLRASEKHLSFVVALDDPTGALRLGDPHRISQILHNLVSNALKFTENGVVRVTVAAPDRGTVTLQVQDSGIGMSPAQQEAIRKPFIQADNSISRRFGGTGLGMSIVGSLVELFGGTLEIDSKPGSGTTVTVSLPLVALEGSGHEIPAACAETVPQRMPGLRVLAVDDNSTNQLVLGLMLGRLAVHATLASNGPEALERFAEREFDLLILDISMPGMDGIALLDAIRAAEMRQGRARAPAIAFTANAMTHQVDMYLGKGFDACLAKPLKLGRLSEVMALLCEVPAGEV